MKDLRCEEESGMSLRVFCFVSGFTGRRLQGRAKERSEPGRRPVRGWRSTAVWSAGELDLRLVL